MKIVKVSDDPSAHPPTVTLGFDPVPGAYGYVLQRADGKRSNSWDPTKKTWKVDADSGPWDITAVSAIDSGRYPGAPTPTGTLVDYWDMLIQPNNHEKDDEYSFAWVKAKRNEIPGNTQSGKEGRIPFDKYPNGVWQVFGRMPSDTSVGRTANWHISPWPDGWDDKPSPYAWDWKVDSEWDGQSGLVAVLEPASAPNHYSIVPKATWRKGGLWWFVCHTQFGRPGRSRVWALDPNLNGSLVLDVRKSNAFPSDSELLFWNGAYIDKSKSMSGPGRIGVTLDGIGDTLEKALADVAKFGSSEVSRANGSGKSSSITKGQQVLRPDSLLRQLVAA